MANKKFSEFVLKTSTSDVSHIVGYNGAENVQITPANFVTGGGTGVFLPLAGGTMVGNTIHNDNVKSIYGDGGDLEIYHSGAGSYIIDSGTGNLDIRADSLSLLNAAGSEYYARFYTNGAAYLYNNGVAKFYTTGTGIEVIGGGVFTGDLTTNGDITIDNASGDPFLKLKTAAQEYVLRIDQSDSEKFQIRNATSSVTALSIDTTSNATFAGGVSITEIASIANDNGISGLQIRAKDDNICYIDFGDSADANIGGINYSNVTDTLNFRTGNSNKVTLDSSGNLGLGTSSPAYKLQVAGSVALDVMAGNETEGAVRIGRSDANTSRYNDIKSFVSSTAASNYLKLAVHGGVENANVNVMTLLGNGNVGIGTSTPYTNLEVAGSGADSIIRLYAAGGTANIRTWEMRAVGVAGEGLLFRQANDANNSYTNRMIIDTDGNVGVGTTTPSEKLEVAGGAAAILIDSTTNEASLKYDNSTTTSSIKLSNNDLKFELGGSERMRLTSAGDVEIKTGSIKVETAGQGIYLGGTASANLLNDYEEGTWTPEVYYQNSTDAGNATNITQTGRYTKIGNKVFVEFRLAWTITGSPATDNCGIKNLPYTGAAASNAFADMPCFIKGYTNPSTGGRGQLAITLPGANSNIAIFSDANVIGNMGVVIGAGTHEIRFAFTYTTDQ